ncbi:MAG: hypothetical protein ACPGQS_08055 [Bradymonadia bacterium]
MRILAILSALAFIGCATVEEIEDTKSQEAETGAAAKADNGSPEASSNPWTESEQTTADSEENENRLTDDELAEETDACVVFDLYNDGQCDRFCEDPDPDCEGIPEEPTFCEQISGERDGFCHSSCGDMDPDCVDEAEAAATWSLDSYFLRVCAGLDNVEDLVEELAESICVGAGAPDNKFDECVNTCLQAYIDAQ